MSELGRKQELFSELIPPFFEGLFKLGYKIRCKDLLRDPRVFGMMGVKKGYGHKNSLHKLGLAIDLALFKDGEYLTKSEDYKPAAELWESLHEDCTAGYHFGDGNHFSLTYRGMR